MFKIGEFAKLNRITISTLRHYDAINLLKPVRIEEATGYRYYSAEQMPYLSRILRLKEMGFSLDEITLIMEGDGDKDGLMRLLSLRQTQIQDNIAREEERLINLKDFMRDLKQEGNAMEYNILLKKTDSIKVAGLRDFISGYTEQGPLWEELVSYINENHGKIVPPCIAIYYDNKGSESLVDAEVLESISGDLKGNERITVRYLESVEAACVVHKGSYGKLGQAYNALSAWIEEKDLKIAGPQRELYLKGEWDSDSEEEYITEIQIPVVKKEAL